MSNKEIEFALRAAALLRPLLMEANSLMKEIRYMRESEGWDPREPDPVIAKAETLLKERDG